MKRILRIILWIFLAAIILFAIQTIRHWDTIKRTMLGGYHAHETVAPRVPANLNRPALLIFSKTNGFRHEEAIPAGNALFARIASEKGWGHFQTENGAVFSPAILAQFDAVVFNNASGDVLLPEQWQAFQAYVEGGGGYVGLHAAGDGSIAWPWYNATMIGAKFTQHTMSPQFQAATVRVEDAAHPATAALPAAWKRTEEWYSFEKSPRAEGFHVLATVDESTYKPIGMFDKDLRMGDDHPAVWSNCAGPKGARRGRTIYTIFGHRAEAFAEPETIKLLTGALAWAVRQEGEGCEPASAEGEPAK